MDLQAYIDSKGKMKVPAAINERWVTRIELTQLHLQGTSGAQAYINRYGLKAGSKKMIHFALKAQSEGCPEMAMVFWARAYRLDGFDGETANATAPVALKALPIDKPIKIILVSGLPNHMQPGKVVPMQPTDAPRDRDHYINSDLYWGQKKRDGQKVLAMVTAEECAFQSRSLKLREMPYDPIRNSLMWVAKTIGPFVVEGELLFNSYADKEHRTEAQAASYNAAQKIAHPPAVCYYIFSRLDIGGTYEDMVLAGNKIAKYAYDAPFKVFGANQDCWVFSNKTFKTTEEKRAMTLDQATHDREGEIWFNPVMQYKPGKDKKHPFYRTKYLIDRVVIVAGLTPTSVEGRPFGAIEVTDSAGNSLGKIGTGFSIEDQKSIEFDFTNRRKEMKIEVRAQRYTETGKLWHARYIKTVPSDTPCV